MSFGPGHAGSARILQERAGPPPTGALDGDGYFAAPTVLIDVPDGAECSREEIFVAP